MIGALTDPFGGRHMRVTAENAAAEFEISHDQYALAVESHRRAAAAAQAGRPGCARHSPMTAP